MHLKKNISIIRIVFSFPPIIGGSVTHVIELSKRINPYLKNQIILAPDFGEECMEFDKNMGIPIIRVKYPTRKLFEIPKTPFKRLAYMMNIYLILKELMKKYNPDLLHIHGIVQIALGGSIIGKLLHIPVVGMLHGSVRGLAGVDGFFETILANLFKPDHFIFLDDGTISPRTVKKLWGEKVTIVSHGIDTDVFKPTKKNSEILKKLGLNKSDFLVLSTSRLINWKNVDLAIKSFKIFLQKIKKDNVYLIIAGEGPLKDQLIELAKNSSIENNVKFLGGIPLENIPDYLSVADILIATSLYSNMNRSVQEAMASGKSVIVFNSGGTSRLIRHMENGFLIKPGDIEDFAEKLRLLYENSELREKIEKNAIETIMEERNWEKRIKKELTVYDKLLYERTERK